MFVHTVILSLSQVVEVLSAARAVVFMSVLDIRHELDVDPCPCRKLTNF